MRLTTASFDLAHGLERYRVKFEADVAGRVVRYCVEVDGREVYAAGNPRRGLKACVTHAALIVGRYKRSLEQPEIRPAQGLQGPAAARGCSGNYRKLVRSLRTNSAIRIMRGED